ncbi:uncharacterized protein LOC115629897 [Scaptodrosophila lebanonensis]|uniref:Uncharacterized protein LOC115629897 n=1 Tax=Drosophila lebanonensis TaxID=7225 RepID=A0A6J2U4F1_DROLE|nr:uncharacterized protein LOC115629897 [Scaptodrosophila lebanonensis]XP_030382358.1 uncharacterized protein LOC115629897 [Scaptodrosophila lebanonensis]
MEQQRNEANEDASSLCGNRGRLFYVRGSRPDVFDFNNYMQQQQGDKEECELDLRINQQKRNNESVSQKVVSVKPRKGRGKSSKTNDNAAKKQQEMVRLKKSPLEEIPQLKTPAKKQRSISCTPSSRHTGLPQLDSRHRRSKSYISIRGLEHRISAVVESALNERMEIFTAAQEANLRKLIQVARHVEFSNTDKNFSNINRVQGHPLLSHGILKTQANCNIYLMHAYVLWIAKELMKPRTFLITVLGIIFLAMALWMHRMGMPKRRIRNAFRALFDEYPKSTLSWFGWIYWQDSN